jgi:alginate O-acetyltransferase complex protein AlgJ
LWQFVISMNRTMIARLSEFERALDEDSLLSSTLRPPAQTVITGWLGAGNERVYRGREGWLFYRPDVEYVTGPGFLDPAQLDRRVAPARASATDPQQPVITAARDPALSAGEGLVPSGRVEPDPRVAISQLRRDLEARGIALVVVPTPLKPGVHPERLARGYADATGVLQNASYGTFVADLRRDGVLVFDPSEALADTRLAGPQYLATDSHWRPEAMEMVVERLGGFIAAQLRLPVTVDPGYVIERPNVRNIGDEARMLDLADDHSLFQPEAASLRRVLQPDGSPWRPSRDADVLVLGDSFSNIYSLESMGWGTSAGFTEQLSYTLRRPLDRLVQNDEGAFATRAMLQRDSGRLDGKRVVVYQFAARELAFGDWKLIPLAAPEARRSR